MQYDKVYWKHNFLYLKHNIEKFIETYEKYSDTNRLIDILIDNLKVCLPLLSMEVNGYDDEMENDLRMLIFNKISTISNKLNDMNNTPTREETFLAAPIDDAGYIDFRNPGVDLSDLTIVNPCPDSAAPSVPTGKYAIIDADFRGIWVEPEKISVADRLGTNPNPIPNAYEGKALPRRRGKQKTPV